MRQHIRMVALKVIWRSDATTIRLILALASLIWAFSAWFSDKPMGPFTILAVQKLGFGVVSIPEWGFLFFLHFAGVMWRTFDPVRRVGWGLAVNSYGLGLWLMLTVTLGYFAGPLKTGLSTDWALCAFSAWALFKTDSTDDSVTA